MLAHVTHEQTHIALLNQDYYENLFAISQLFSDLIKTNVRMYCSCVERKEYETLLGIDFHIANTTDQLSLKDQSIILLRRVQVLLEQALRS